MNEKDSFSQITVRVMDVDLEERFRRAYLMNRGSFDSKSKFMIYLATLGLEQAELRLPKSDGKNGAEKNMDCNEVISYLNSLTNYLKDQITQMQTDLYVLEKFAASTQEAILQFCDGTKVDREAIEKGFIDKLPKRFRILFVNPDVFNGAKCPCKN